MFWLSEWQYVIINLTWVGIWGFTFWNASKMADGIVKKDTK